MSSVLLVPGIRMLDGSVTDVVEGHSLAFRQNHIDIYSSSWGPDDDGRTLDGPGPLAQRAFQMGVETVREGVGGRREGGREGVYCGQTDMGSLSLFDSVHSCLTLHMHMCICVSVCAGSRWQGLHLCVGCWQWWPVGGQLQL